MVVLALAARCGWPWPRSSQAGRSTSCLSTCRNAISQAYTPDGLRGRIQGAMTVVLMGGPQLAGLVHGFGGALVGARWAIGPAAR